MSTFWQNFDIWAELAFGIHFGLLFELHRGGIMKNKGPETRFFDIWALFELSSLFCQILTNVSWTKFGPRGFARAFRREAGKINASSVLPAPRVSSSKYYDDETRKYVESYYEEDLDFLKIKFEERH